MSFSSSTVYTLFFILFTVLFGKLLLHLDINKRVYNHVPGECSIIPNLPGALDFETTTHGKLFMSLNSFENSSSTGYFFTFNPDNRTATELVIEEEGRKLKPGALSITPGKRDVKLYVFNKDTSNVLVYGLNETKNYIMWKKTLKNREFVNLNSIAAVDSQSFYFTTESLFMQSELFSVIERVFSIPTARLAYFDGHKVKNTERIATPTGLVYDEFRKVLLISSFTRNSILVYSAKSHAKLKFVREVDIGCSPLSMWKDFDGSLIVSCQPVRIRYLLNLFNESLLSPSMILRVNIPARLEKEVTINQLYSNDGATISKANLAARAGKTILISNGQKILNCLI